MSSSRPSPRYFASGLVWALLLAPAGVAAQAAAPTPYSAPQQVQLQYAAGAGCPSQTAFVNEVGARIRRPIEWVAANPSTLIVVTLGQADEHATGKLEVTRSPAEPTRREFIASSCAEVGSALALVTALTLDPNARTEPLLPAAPSSAQASAAQAPVPVTVFPGPTSAPPPAAPTPGPVPAPPAAPAAPSGNDVVAWVGPTAGVSGGYAPEPLVTFGLTLGARVRVNRDFAPSLQLTPLWGKTGSTGPAATGASFAWSMARLDACPTDFRLAAPLFMAACATAEAGQLLARGSADQIVPVAAERLWFAAGVSASLHFRAGAWFTRLGAQALFPATRDEFVFKNPDQSIHKTGLLVYGASLGLGFQFGS